MKPKRELSVASEGIPFLLVLAALIAGFVWHGYFVYAGIAALVFAILTLIFRDPPRTVPAAPLGVVSPVDGTVVDVSTDEEGILNGPAHRVTIRVNSLGTYTARSPVEGKVMELRNISQKAKKTEEAGGLWLRTDEGIDVLLKFHGNRFGIAPRACLRYGERVGQGQRCAMLRLTKFAEVQLPESGRVLVTAGQEVTAGEDLLGNLPHP